MVTSKSRPFTIQRRDIMIILVIIIYRIALDIIYKNYIFAEYAYYHFSYNSDPLLVFFSYVLLLPIIIFVPSLINRGQMTDIVLILQILMYYVSSTSLFCFSTHNIQYALFTFAYFLLLLFFNHYINLSQVHFKGPRTGIGDTKFFVYLIVALGFLRIVASGLYTGFRISFDLSVYYEYRAEAREYSMPEVFRYLLGWSTTGLTVGLAYSVVKRKRFLTIYIIACTILAFSFNGKKSILFFMLLSIVVGLFYKDKHLNKVPTLFTGLGCLGLIELLIRGSESFICKHFIRRMIFIPPHIGNLYYDFFSDHPFDYLRSSVLRRFGAQSPYGNIPRHIGSIYFGNRSMAFNANTGLCGDAFANFGYLSLLIAPLVIVLTYKIIERCAINVDNRVKVVVAVFAAYSFENGAYFTLLLTNGMLFLMVLLAILNGRKQSLNAGNSLISNKDISYE